jgi:hypothetical protein
MPGFGILSKDPIYKMTDNILHYIGYKTGLKNCAQSGYKTFYVQFFMHIIKQHTKRPESNNADDDDDDEEKNLNNYKSRYGLCYRING